MANHGHLTYEKTNSSTVLVIWDNNTDFLQMCREKIRYGQLKPVNSIKDIEENNQTRNKRYQTILHVESLLTSCKVGIIESICFGDDWDSRVRYMLDLAGEIKKKINKGRGFDKRMVDKCFKDHADEKKKRYSECFAPQSDNYFIEDYNDLKRKLDDLQENKAIYEKENGKEFYAKAHLQLSQKVWRADWKSRCFKSFSLLRFVDATLRCFLDMDREFKEKLWDKFLKPIDNYFETQRHFDNDVFTDWHEIEKNYWEKPEIQAPPFFSVEELRKHCLIFTIGFEFFEMEREEEQLRDAGYRINDCMPPTSSQPSGSTSSR